MLGVLMIVIGAMGLQGMSKANKGLRTVYEDRTVPMGQLSSIQRLLLTNRLRITAATFNTATPEEIQKYTDEVEQNIQEVTKTWNAYMATYLTPEEKILAEKFAEDRKRFVVEGLKPAIAALRANDMTQANNVITDKIHPLYEPVGEGILNLLQLQMDVAKQEFELAQSRYGHTRNIATGLIAMGIIVALWLSFTLLRAILRPIDATTNLFSHIARGELKPIEIEREDEMGKMMEGFKLVQAKFGFDMAESKRIADESLRIKIGLDSVSTAVMIADSARNIIYVNKSMVNILSTAEAGIRKQLPNFTAANLLGTNIDGFT
jgi:methyl-accepting chemotaxis protein